MLTDPPHRFAGRGKSTILDLVKYLPKARVMPALHQQRVGAVRRFNRFYTRQIGVLRKSYLDSSYSLGEMRVLYEMRTAAPAPPATSPARSISTPAISAACWAISQRAGLSAASLRARMPARRNWR
jgi:hypothetical protein